MSPSTLRWLTASSYVGVRLGGHSWSGRLENRAPRVRYGRAALPKGTGTLLLAVPKQHTKLAGRAEFCRVLHAAPASHVWGSGPQRG